MSMNTDTRLRLAHIGMQQLTEAIRKALAEGEHDHECCANDPLDAEAPLGEYGECCCWKRDLGAALPS